MNILECLETGAFNELINFSFSEVREVFNLNCYFVPDEKGDHFIAEASQVKKWYAILICPNSYHIQSNIAYYSAPIQPPKQAITRPMLSPYFSLNSDANFDTNLRNLTPILMPQNAICSITL